VVPWNSSVIWHLVPKSTGGGFSSITGHATPCHWNGGSNFLSLFL
jgi:hypothetical protein